MAHKKRKTPRRIPISKYPFTPSTYPGKRPRFSFFFTPSGIYRLKLRSLARFLADRNLPGTGNRFAVLAYGSNACPDQLKQKQQDERARALTGVPVVYGRLTGTEAVFAGTPSRRGYIPATLARKRGSRSSWITFLTTEQLKAMDVSEGRKRGTYVLAKVSGVQFCIGRSEFTPLYAYVAARVMTLNSRPIGLRSMRQKRAKSAFDPDSTSEAKNWLDFEDIPYPNLPTEYSRIVRC